MKIRIQNRERFRLLVLFPSLLAAIAIVAVIVTMSLLYKASIEQRRDSLVATVKSQAKLIEAIARFESNHSRKDHPNGASGATLSQIVDAHSRYEGFGESGEFTMARLENDHIVFLLSHRHEDDFGTHQDHAPVPMSSKLAEPMRRALNGKSGTLFGLDYRGELVLAAHEPISETNWGIVAKIDMREIKAPFQAAALIAIGSVLGFIILGTWVAVRLGAPVLNNLEQNEAKLRAILETAADGIVTIDSTGHIEMFNPAATKLFGYSESEVIGKNVSILMPKPHDQEHNKYIRNYLSGGEAKVIGHGREVVANRKDGTAFPCHLAIGEIQLPGQKFFVGTLRDLTGWKRAEEVQAGLIDENEELILTRQRMEQKNDDLEKTLNKLKKTQDDLLQAEKMVSVGQLAAGIAHEINTPIQFVGDNVRSCSDMFDDIKGVVNEYRALVEELEHKGLVTESVAHLRALEAEVEIDYIFQDAPKAFSQCLDGIERVRTIVLAMKEFSHVDNSAKKTEFDLNASLQSTITVARNEWKYVADLETDFADIPLVFGFPSELNQVFLNILINSAHAIEDKGNEKGTISIQTALEDDWVVVSITDTGCGIPESIRRRIFDPFFTTKEVGRGTGQGLAISYSIIVDRHQGRIDLETEEGVGSTFHIWLPLKCNTVDADQEQDKSAAVC